MKRICIAYLLSLALLFACCIWMVEVKAGPVMMMGGGTPAAGGSGIYTNDADLLCLYRFEDNLLDTTANNLDLTVSAGDTLDYVADNKSVGVGDSKSVNFDQENAEFAYVANASLPATFPGISTDLDAGTGGFSVVFWIKPASLPADTTYDSVIGKGDTSWWVRLAESGGNVQFNIYDSTWRVKSAGAGAVSTGTWYHFAMTLATDGTDLMIVYKNGVALTPNTTVTACNANTVQFTVADYDGTKNMFDGLIDEVAVFKRTLTADEVTEIYTNGIQDP